METLSLGDWQPIIIITIIIIIIIIYTWLSKGLSLGHYCGENLTQGMLIYCFSPISTQKLAEV